MTATEELRRMLDERGVEYTVVHGYHEYIWEFGESGIARASAIGTKGLVQMIVTGITPAQAIAATLGNEGVGRSNDGVAELGAGTCRLDGYTDAMFRVCSGPEGTDFIDYAEVCECSSCGASVIVPHEYERVAADSDELWPKFNFCPNCGAKVVEPTTNDVDAEVDDG